jgi:hypothetical protein
MKLWTRFKSLICSHDKTETVFIYWDDIIQDSYALKMGRGQIKFSCKCCNRVFLSKTSEIVINKETGRTNFWTR